MNTNQGNFPGPPSKPGLANARQPNIAFAARQRRLQAVPLLAFSPP